MADDIIDLGAAAIAAGVAAGRFSAVEVTAAFLARIAAVDGRVNAIPTLNPEARAEAAAVDRRRAAGEPARPLEGVPYVVKDILPTKGLRTTFGSRLMADNVPDADIVAVERLRAAGAVTMAKANTPEFAHNVNTTNPLFGTTRNPWDLRRSAGGSSGGTGAAVAARLVPIGIGTDLGGSIRVPSALNGICGIRPTPGRVPYWPNDFAWDILVPHVQGPMCADVADCGLMLQVMAGPDDRDPTSLPATGIDFAAAAATPADLRGVRIAYSPDLRGVLPVDPEVARIVREAVDTLAGLGAIVEEAFFDPSGLAEIVAGTRAFAMIGRYADRFDAHSELMTPPLFNQVSASLKFDARRVLAAERGRTDYWHRVRTFLETYDFIVTPAAGLAAARPDQPLPTHVGERELKGFGEVFISAYAFSITGLPSMSVPAGFTAEGLPVGMQVVGRRQREDRVLGLAAAYHAARPQAFRRPEVDLATPLPEQEFDSPGVRIG